MNDILSLGTANFGLPYGLGNHGMYLHIPQLNQILTAAMSSGFSHLDTASSYGTSEQVLGNLLPDKTSLRFTTKLSARESRDAKSIVEAVKSSLDRTKQTRYWSVLLHDPKVLFEKDSKEVQLGLREIVDTGMTELVGISAYDESEVVRAKVVAPFLSVFQIPENVCDQRLRDSSNLTALAEEGNQILVRSVFLQGLLLMNPLSLPIKVATASSCLKELSVFCQEHNVSILDLCLGYARSLPWSSGLILGVDSVLQIHQIAKSLRSTIKIDYSSAPKLDHWLLDPRNWS